MLSTAATENALFPYFGMWNLEFGINQQLKADG
jgi:hypothetical protein